MISVRSKQNGKRIKKIIHGYGAVAASSYPVEEVSGRA
jgi:hypothetical protein